MGMSLLKKKILIISQANVIAGAEIVLIDYLRKNNEFEFLFFTNELMRDYIEKNLERFDGVISKSAFPSLNYIKAINNMILNLFYVNRIVRDKQIDIIYANNTYDAILTCLYKFFFKKEVSIVLHVHDIIDKRKVRYILKIFEKYIDKIIVPSNATKKSVEKNIKNYKLVDTVYNSVNLNNKNTSKKFLSKYNGQYKIGFIGRIVDIKRVDLFVDIIKELQSIRDDCVGIIAGEIIDNNLFKKINLQIKTNNLKCDYIGAFSSQDIKNVYKELDLLVLTSDRDPLPTVILESMSCETIVLARNVDGVSEIIDDKIDGFIFDYKENAQCIAAKINNILNIEQYKKELLIAKAREKINYKFSIEAKQTKLNKILNNL